MNNEKRIIYKLIYSINNQARINEKVIKIARKHIIQTCRKDLLEFLPIVRQCIYSTHEYIDGGTNILNNNVLGNKSHPLYIKLMKASKKLRNIGDLKDFHQFAKNYLYRNKSH